MKKLGILAAVILFTMPACAGSTVRSDIGPVAEAAIATATIPVAATPTNIPAPPIVTTQPIQVSSPDAAAAAPSPTPTQPPTMTPLPTATLTPTPDIDWTTVTGRTIEGLNYLGDPQAPVTMIDFSDFM